MGYIKKIKIGETTYDIMLEDKYICKYIDLGQDSSSAKNMEKFTNQLNTLSGLSEVGFYRIVANNQTVAEVHNIQLSSTDKHIMQILKGPFKFNSTNGLINIDTNNYITAYRNCLNGVWNEWTTTNTNSSGEIDSNIINQINSNTTSIQNEIKRATTAENDLNERINNIPILNDGIVLKKGVLVESGVKTDVTNYAYSNKILGNGETITVGNGYRIINFKLYEGEEELWFDNNYNDTTLLLEKGYIYQFSVLKDGGIITNYNDIVKSFIRNPYAWDSNSNINNFLCEGRYVISGRREANANDNMPITNNGNIEGKLDVMSNNNVISQTLTLLNVNGGDGNVYTRTKQNNQWKPWGKLQTNIEVGMVNQTQMDDLVDNGIYSGVFENKGNLETFVLIVINNYAVAETIGDKDKQSICQLKYGLSLHDSAGNLGGMTLKTRKRDAFGFWGAWKTIYDMNDI